jgi:tricorn protease
MVGELRTSHLGSGFYGGESDDGFIGILFAAEPLLREGRLIVERILPDGPAALASAPPQPGEELIAIDGTHLNGSISIHKLLLRSAGRRVRIRLRANDGNEREIVVRAIGQTAYQELRYRDWVLTNEQYVHRLSEGQLGYVHIAEMSYSRLSAIFGRSRR